jgi:hypothetical protein
MQAHSQERVPFEAYTEIEAAHASALKDLLVSPRLYRWRRDNDRPDSDLFRVGRACHTAVLEPERFLADYVLWDGGIRRGKEWDAFRTKAEAKGRTILKQDQYELALAVRDAVRSHAVASALLRDGRPELSLRWTHERTGTPCKARVDWLGSALVDIKTARDVSPRAFSAAAARLGYALQLALYRAGVHAVTGELPPVKIIAVQNCAPYDVAVFDVTAETLAIGEQQYEGALDLLAECTRKNEWPGLAPDAEVPLVLPAWAAPEADEEPITFGGEVIA